MNLFFMLAAAPIVTERGPYVPVIPPPGFLETCGPSLLSLAFWVGWLLLLTWGRAWWLKGIAAEEQFWRRAGLREQYGSPFAKFARGRGIVRLTGAMTILNIVVFGYTLFLYATRKPFTPLP